MDERFYYLGFSVFPGIGPVKFSLLLQHFTTAKDVWEANSSDLQTILGEKTAQKFIKFRDEFSFDKYVERLTKNNISFLTLEDKEYPKSVKQIPKAPFVLYLKGNKNLLYSSDEVRSSSEESELDSSRFASLSRTVKTQPVVAVVGTRKVTQYGRQVTEQLTKELVFAGVTIVSGLALGVDAIAHKAALDNGGKTIAVLGCGVDCCSPSENQNLYDEILEKDGCIISELPLGHSPTKGSFPARNRIVAGLSDGILVTEGAADSGALITAEYGLQYRKKVFAIPGPITSSLSLGPHALIEKGARLVMKGEHIIESIKGTKSIRSIKSAKEIRGDTEEEDMILKLLVKEPLHFDMIVRRTGIPSANLGSLLSMMEIKGYIKEENDVYSL